MRWVNLALWPVRKLWVGCAFEDGWDVAGWLCLTLGIALMSLGTVASPDVPFLSASEPGYCDTVFCNQSAQCLYRVPGFCDPKNTGCWQSTYKRCETCECVEDAGGACYCYPPAQPGGE